MNYIENCPDFYLEEPTVVTIGKFCNFFFKKSLPVVCLIVYMTQIRIIYVTLF